MATQLTNQQVGRAVYLGLIDDKVFEYPWGTDVTADYFETLLLQAALFEQTVLVNDGHLMLYDWGRRMLANPNSLFRQLMREGIVVVLSREDGGAIDQMPARHADDVPTYQRLVRDAEWKEVERDLKGLVASGQYVWTKWPPVDNRVGFSVLVESLYDSSPDDLGVSWHLTADHLRQCIDEFRNSRRSRPTDGARGLWEAVVTRLFGGQPRQCRALMQIANEAYHYNMTLSFAAASGLPAGAATRFSPVFAPRFESRRNSSDVFPELSLHLGRMASPGDAVLQAVRDPDIRAAKVAFLDSRDAFRNDLVHEREAVDRYAQLLRRHFASLGGQGASRVATVALGVGAAAVNLAGALAVGAPVVTVALVGFGVSGISTVGSVYAPHALGWWRELNMNNPVVVRNSAPSEFAALGATGTTWLAPAHGASHGAAVAGYTL